MSDLAGIGISNRDRDLERAAPAITTLLPLRALETIAVAAEMNARILEVNLGIFRHLLVGNKLPQPITEFEYCTACRAASSLEECVELVHLVTGLGRTLESLVRIPMIGMTLRAMRLPAHAAGFAALQAFLENGYRTFRQIPDIPHFLLEIESRMTDVFEKIYTARWSRRPEPVRAFRNYLRARIPVESAAHRRICMLPHNDVVAEVMGLPDGPQIGAFFDFDGTIISGYSVMAFIKEQVRRGHLSPRELVELLSAMASFGLGGLGFSGMMVAATQFLRGIREDSYANFGEELFESHIARLIYPESRALIQAHLKKGHTVAIITSATPYQVRPAARELGIEHVLCTELEVKDGVFTGAVVQPLCFGPGQGRRRGNALAAVQR